MSSFTGEATASPANTPTARPALHRSITAVHKGRNVMRENGSYSPAQSSYKTHKDQSNMKSTTFLNNEVFFHPTNCNQKRRNTHSFLSYSRFLHERAVSYKNRKRLDHTNTSKNSLFRTNHDGNTHFVIEHSALHFESYLSNKKVRLQ